MTDANEVRRPGGERHDFASLCLATSEQLEHALRRGVAPEMGAMVGWEYKGYAPGRLSTVPGLAKHKKGFYSADPGRDPALGISGYTVACHSNAIGEPWIERTCRGRQVRFGWFDLAPVGLTDPENFYPRALLLHVGPGPRALALAPTRTLLGYLVQVDPDEPDLLLGKTYLAAGPARVFLTYFVLERHNEAVAR